MPPGAIIKARLLAASGSPEAQLVLAGQLSGQGAATEAVRHIAAAAHDGLPEAQGRLGICYLRGQGVPPNQAEARHWLELAAEAGDVPALTELAALALGGVWGPYQRSLFPGPATEASAAPNHNLAARLARRASTAGSAEAQALLGFILRASPALAETPGEADTWYRRSSLAGWPMGQLGHALTLLREHPSPASVREAHELLSAAAEAGLPTAHFLLGAMAESGANGERDPEAAAEHYRISAEHGHTNAKTRLGLALLEGRGTERNLLEGETWLRRAALEGDVTAAAVLGDFHASSARQPPNLEEAARWYRRAAELGHPGCARTLALAISAGAEGKPDAGEIAVWLETAIERGDNAAWPELGYLIASASLPKTHLPELHGWLQRMMRQDHPDAGYYVGICVNSGIGTPANEVLARRYYIWAAGEGVVEAMVAAGEMLLNGRGGPADPELARDLFECAAAANHAGASFALGVMSMNEPDRGLMHFRRAAALGHEKARLFAARDPVAA